MSIEIKVPEVGESIQEVQIGRWLKSVGESVSEDETIAELETEKASLDLPAPSAGALQEILKSEGEVVGIGDVIAIFEAGGGKSSKKSKKSKKQKESAKAPAQEKKDKRSSSDSETVDNESDPSSDSPKSEVKPHATPSARRELRKHDLSAEDIEPAKKRIHGEDVRRFVQEKDQQRPTGKDATDSQSHETELEEVVKMSFLRKRIAQRLVAAQQTAALLTTFNEVDMSHVMALRKEHGEEFKKRYGVKLGFMSFFVKAIIDALKQQPELNAEIRNQDEIVYRHYYHIGVAIGSESGLVVPVLRNAQRLSFAEIELAIDDFARRANRSELTPDELQGGTFTISNGGVYGSLLSTPIVNPPQSGVVGMHAIEDRPIARDGKVVIRPMMYVALTYDHRIVDGREAVTFLRRVKESIEEPARMLVEV